MKQPKRLKSASKPGMVSQFDLTMAFAWNSYAIRLTALLVHYGPEAFNEETYAILRFAAVSLTSMEHLEMIETYMMEGKRRPSCFVGGARYTPPTNFEQDLLEKRVDQALAAAERERKRER